MCWCACLCMRLWVRACVLGSRLLYLHVWSEHLSSPSRRCKTTQAGRCRRRCRERDWARFQTFAAETFLNCLLLGAMCTDATRQILFYIIFLFPSFTLSHANTAIKMRYKNTWENILRSAKCQLLKRRQIPLHSSPFKNMFSTHP